MYRYLFLCWIFPAFLSAQDNFFPGYILRSGTGERTEASVEYGNWKYTPQMVRYRLSEDHIQTGTPGTLGGFGWEKGRKFVSLDVAVETSFDNNVNEVITDRDPLLTHETRDLHFEDRILFAEVILEGDLVLYQYEERHRLRYFVQNEQGELFPLVNKHYFVDQEPRFNRDYLRTLSRKFPIAAEVVRITDVKFTDKDLVAYLMRYALERDLRVTPVVNQLRNRVRIGGQVGVGTALYRFPDQVEANIFIRNANGDIIGSNRRVLHTLNNPTTLGYRGAARLEINLPLERYAWSFLVGIDAFEGTFQEAETDSEFVHRLIGITPLDIRRYIPVGKNSVWLLVGVRGTVGVESTIIQRIGERSLPNLPEAYAASFYTGIRLKKNLLAELEFFPGGQVTKLGFTANYRF